MGTKTMQVSEAEDIKKKLDKAKDERARLKFDQTRRAYTKARDKFLHDTNVLIVGEFDTNLDLYDKAKWEYIAANDELEKIVAKNIKAYKGQDSGKEESEADSLLRLLQVAIQSVGGKRSDIKQDSSYEAAGAGGYNYEEFLTIQDLSKLPDAASEGELKKKDSGYEVLMWGSDSSGYHDLANVTEAKHFNFIRDAVEWFCLVYCKQAIYQSLEMDIQEER